MRFITFSDSTGTSYGAKYTGGTVTITEANSTGVARIVTTSSFGTFRFDAVAPGETYTIAVRSQRYRFP